MRRTHLLASAAFVVMIASTIEAALIEEPDAWRLVLCEPAILVDHHHVPDRPGPTFLFAGKPGMFESGSGSATIARLTGIDLAKLLPPTT